MTSKSFLYKKVGRLAFGLIVIFCFGLLGLFYAWNYSELYALYPEYIISQNATDEELEPYEKLYFKFSQPVNEELFKESFSISPDIQGELTFFGSFLQGYSRGFVFAPKAPFEPEQDFNIHVNSLKSFFGTEFQAFDKHIKTVSPPEISSISMNGDKEGASINPTITVVLNNESKFFINDYILDPETPLEVTKLEDGGVALKPKIALSLGTDYQLHINQTYRVDDSLGKRSEIDHGTRSYSFRTADPIVVKSVSPSSGEDRALINSEIKVQFDRPVEYEMAESSFTIEPSVEGDFGWEDSTLIFSPKEELGNPQEYTVSIASGLKAFNDKGFLEDDYSFTFKSRRHEKEIDPDEDLVPAILDGRYIDVDLGSQYLTLFEDGVSRGTFQISSGKYDLPTPRGTFKIINKVPIAYSATYDLYMPFWMAFTYAGHGFHELPFWKYRSGIEYKERESHLGTRVSHGCVRLGVGPAEIAYNFADVGTPVVIHD